MKIASLLPGLLVLALTAPTVAAAAVVEIRPSSVSCGEEFVAAASRLQPGDELVLRGGIYSQSCRRAITVNGTAAAPIVIRAASGERAVLTRPADTMDTQNNIEIVNSSYLIVRGLAFQGGSSSVRIMGGHHITLEDCEIFETGNNAVAVNYDNADALVFRGNHIHHTGLSVSAPTEGEGFYLGCNHDTCRVTNSVIEGNYIHHLRGTSDGGNDGVEIKVGSHGNRVRHNVIHDTTIGRRYPCILVYGAGPGLNIVEDNVMWNCGEAIQVVSDAIVRNNIVLSSDVGILTAPHIQVPGMRNVTIVNNTLYGHRQQRALLSGNERHGGERARRAVDHGAGQLRRGHAHRRDARSRAAHRRRIRHGRLRRSRAHGRVAAAGLAPHRPRRSRPCSRRRLQWAGAHVPGRRRRLRSRRARRESRLADRPRLQADGPCDPGCSATLTSVVSSS